nr:hypothetical protein [Leucobacter sp. wl10]
MHARQIPIEQQHVGVEAAERGERGIAAVGDLHLVPLVAQAVGEQLGEVALVLRDQNAHAALLPLPATGSGLPQACTGSGLARVRRRAGWRLSR